MSLGSLPVRNLTAYPINGLSGSSDPILVFAVPFQRDHGLAEKADYPSPREAWSWYITSNAIASR